MNDTYLPQPDLLTIDLDHAEPPHVEGFKAKSHQPAGDSLLPIVE
jgi:hypothetical protein